MLQSKYTPISEFIVVRNSPIHGKGVFATQKISKGTRIIQYLGEIVSKEEGTRREAEQAKNGQVFVFELNDTYDIDGAAEHNTARLINCSCDPNCEAVIGEEIWIVSIKDISPGEELTYDYGFDLENYQRFPCRCGALRCVGYVVGQEYWEELAKKTKQL